MPRSTDVLVVGGGAAGLMCAGVAACRGKSVTVIEKMERPARKLMITGKGRCNLTNNCGGDELLASVRSNPRFLYSAFAAFSPGDLMRMFEGRGLALKTERGNRVFPQSDRAVDVVDVLVGFATGSGAKILTRKRCSNLLLNCGIVSGVELTGGERLEAKAVVIATGGLSYPLTGSTGDGYALAAQAGHTIIPQRASLVPIETAESWPRACAGLSLKNVTLSLWRQGSKKPVFSELGEMLFTHFGVSGPLVLSASAHMSGQPGGYSLSIDLKPGLSPEQLDARILRDFSASPNRGFPGALDKLLPRSLIPVVGGLSGVSEGTEVNAVTREQRRGLVSLLKGLRLSPRAFRPIEEAVVTSGGVKVTEVDPKTMQSKLAKGLYFAGEILDVDAYTGGFNLQIAFSTGYVAGMNAQEM